MSERKEMSSVLFEGTKDCSCRTGDSVPYDKWKAIPYPEKVAVSQWIQEFIVPEEDPFGESCCYRQFEFQITEAPTEAEFQEIKRQFLEPYLHLKDSRGDLIPSSPVCLLKEENEALRAICIPGCRLLIHERAAYKRDPNCMASFIGGVRAEFRLELPRLRNRRSKDGNRAEKTILIHDLRLLGRPVIVELQYLPVQNKEQMSRLIELPCCYPGSGKRPIRFSRRLGNRIDEAIIHGLKKGFIAEASAIPIDTIYHWADRSRRSAAKALPKAQASFALDHCQESAVYTFRVPLRIQDQYGFLRTRKFEAIFRQEPGRPWRLTAFYREYEWSLLQKLAAGNVPDSILWSQELPISPQRLFPMAMDYLSKLCGAHQGGLPMSPSLGAMLFLALSESSSPGSGEQVLRECGSKDANFYCSCYQDLQSVYRKVQADPFSALECALPVVMGWEVPDSATASPLRRSLWKWREDCLASAEQKHIRITLRYTPVQKMTEVDNIMGFFFDRIFHFPLPSEVASAEDLFTRLLILNPVTMSTSQINPQASAGSEQGGNGQDPRHFPLVLCEDGTPDFGHVIPGMELPQLESLMRQGFPAGERTTLLQRSMPEEDHIE